MLGGIGVPELLIILVVVLLIFGPKNLPKLGSSIGKTVKNFQDGMKEGASNSEKVEGKEEKKSEKIESTSEKKDA